MNVVQLSENTLVVLFEQTINLDVSQQVTAVMHAVEQPLSEYIIDIVPSYASIHMLFDLRKTTGQQFLEKVNTAVRNISVQTLGESTQEVVAQC